MEKIGILRWRSPDESPDSEDLLAAGDRLARAGHYTTVLTEHTGDAAAFRYGEDPDGLVLSSMASVWVDQVEQHTEVADQLPPAARTVAYLLAESIPLDWQDRDWLDGTTSPGVTILTALCRLDGLDDDTFFGRWHGSHSKLTFEIHPIKRYVRNTVVRRLGDGPFPFDAIVPEGFDPADVLDPTRFYGVGEPERGWEEAMGVINDDLVTWCDMTRLQTTPCDEHILASAPWEAPSQ